ncbi:uncharacterized protein BDR25DRAFT_341339 [Lindgomyces ingoldianus]|uniref:Uncharacterized protein n=1 Tax=Lindgomyces ingoldianus TaxID=673940 RepID=A0ACB6R4F2_9PLEO|nr:uncharacterized protein BDR25DRAFT_341339 [Lindgomyces ingoldianus]KAF2473197.1 hypothetical protein BDR25DRAFT_341339 [Lindgomyces ingoldianus]
MVVAYPMGLLVFTLLVASFVDAIAGTGAEVLDRDFPEPQDILSLAPEQLGLGNATVSSTERLLDFGMEDSRKEGPQKVNTNAFAYANIFKRAGCTFTRSGDPRTCVTTGDICCTDPNNAQDGWCCPATDGCGPGTGTLGKCTYRITYITSTYYTTSYTTKYETFTTSIPASTEWTTIVSTSVEVVTRSDVDTATEWDTVTITRAANKARWGPTAHPPCHSTPIATATGVTLSSASPAAEKHQKPLMPEVTPAAKLHMRGLLQPRQMRTDTSTRYYTSTVYVTSSVEITSQIFYTQTSTKTSTTVSTRTSALNAKTTVHSTTTLTLKPGESAPAQPAETTGPAGGGGNNGGGGGGGNKGLSTGAKAGIGAGTAGGSLVICIILGFFLARRRKNKKKEVTEMINQAVTAATAAGPGQHPPDNKYSMQMAGAYGPPPPNSQAPSSPPPPSSQGRYSDIIPVYGSGAPSPAPMYSYPNQSVPQNYPSQSPPPQGYEMSATPMPAPVPMAYHYPRPPSPGGQSPGAGSPQQMQRYEMQGPAPPQEVPANVYSPNMQYPQPYRNG